MASIVMDCRRTHGRRERNARCRAQAGWYRLCQLDRLDRLNRAQREAAYRADLAALALN